VLKDQRPPTAPGHEIARLLAQKLPEASAQHALVLTGVRRCGKSVLQAQLLRTHPGALYVNAEDTRLYGIEPADFPALVEVVAELAGDQAVFLDEIQELPEWPRLVRALLDRGHPLCVTGSNASLLHREMGAKLTGRHRSFEVFPFSYPEYRAFQSAKNSAKTLQGYLDDGGFPGLLTPEQTAALLARRDQELHKRLRAARVRRAKRQPRPGAAPRHRFGGQRSRSPARRQHRGGRHRVRPL